MNKTKFFSSLLVAVLFATTSVFVSCKDYDDDIKNLQSQIDKAALKADLDALSTKLAGVESTANAAKTTAESALAKANANATEIAAVKATAEKAAADAAKALTDVAKAQSTADAAQKAAEAAQKTADEAKAFGEAAATKKELTDAVEKLEKSVKDLEAVAATKTELADAKTELKAYTDAAKAAAIATANAAAEKALTDAKGYTDAEVAKINESLKTLATQAAVEKLSKDLNDEITGLKTTLAAITGEEEMAELVKIVGSFDTIVETLFSAVTSVELYASYSWNSSEANSLHNQMFTNSWGNQGNIQYYTGISPLDLYFTHGTVSEDSKFGDNEAYTAADKQIEYKKGADIKDATELIIRVNPVNADITNANIKLINSLGEALDVVTVTKAERYNELITRGSSVNSGLWKLTLKAADGISEEIFEKAVRNTTATTAYKPQIAFAVAVNNTAENSEDRYVASTFDLVASYGTYVPASAFGFSVNGTDVNQVRNRWNTNLEIQAEQQRQTSTNNPELAWVDNSDEIPTPATAIVGKVGDDNTNVEIDNNKYYYETRRWYSFVYADVNEPFVLSDFYGNVGNKAIDYYYVVFDKGNAIESAPSEWNAWSSYTVEGLGVMTPVDQDLTMKITSASAKGDVVGFRVYAVNRDGTLADPDGRAFYVYVGKKGEENKEASAKIVATETQPESEAMDVKGWFKADNYYYFAPNDVNTRNRNPKWITSATQYGDFAMSNVILNFYKEDDTLLGSYTDTELENGIAGATIKDAVKVTFTPNDNIAGMLNDSTYTIFISQYLDHAGDYPQSLYATLSVTKVMPDKAETLEFRPKQETTEGSGDFIAYMIPNEYAWDAPWATDFTDISTAANMTKAYEATTARTNGFKDLNNVFYDLNKKDNIEFVFANSLKKDNKVVDLVDGNKQGIVYGTPGRYYILDVHKDFIDGKTKHNVQTYTHYFGVSTYYDKNNNLVYGEDWTLKSDQKLTATYACWHHAMHTIEFWKKDNKNNEVTDTPELKWTATGATVNKEFKDIRTKNSYNNDYFGLKLNVLVLDNKWLTYVDDSAELNTKADGTGQKNPYFKPEVNDEGKITFTQNSVQVDANPTADHDEYLVMKFKDAFEHEVLVSAKVLVKKAATAAPRH